MTSRPSGRNSAPEASGTGIDFAKSTRTQPATAALPSVALGAGASSWWWRLPSLLLPQPASAPAKARRQRRCIELRYQAVTDRPYLVKEIFGPTLQGEGAHAGRACVF